MTFVEIAINAPSDQPLLRARGYLIAGILVQAAPADSFPITQLLDLTIKSINDDDSEIVKVACLKATQGYTRGGSLCPSDRQVPICTALSQFLNSQDFTDLEDCNDLLVMLVESLGSAININPSICFASGVNVLDMLFIMAQHGSRNIQLTMLVNETFERIVEELATASPEAYGALCGKVLPSLTGAFDVSDVTDEPRLKTVSLDFTTIHLRFFAETYTSSLLSSFVCLQKMVLNLYLLVMSQPSCRSSIIY